jgi:hypothetical protein
MTRVEHFKTDKAAADARVDAHGPTLTPAETQGSATTARAESMRP